MIRGSISAVRLSTRVIYFGFKVFGHLGQHFVQRTGFFTDADHLYQHVGEQVFIL